MRSPVLPAGVELEDEPRFESDEISASERQLVARAREGDPLPLTQ